MSNKVGKEDIVDFCFQSPFIMNNNLRLTRSITDVYDPESGSGASASPDNESDYTDFKPKKQNGKDLIRNRR